MKVILGPLHKDIDRIVRAARLDNRTVSHIELTLEEKQILESELNPPKDRSAPLTCMSQPTWNTYKGIPIVTVKDAS